MEFHVSFIIIEAIRGGVQSHHIIKNRQIPTQQNHLYQFDSRKVYNIMSIAELKQHKLSPGVTLVFFLFCLLFQKEANFCCISASSEK